MASSCIIIITVSGSRPDGEGNSFTLQLMLPIDIHQLISIFLSISLPHQPLTPTDHHPIPVPALLHYRPLHPRNVTEVMNVPLFGYETCCQLVVQCCRDTAVHRALHIQ